MAGDWMKIELELPDKPEVHAMAGMLGIDPDAVVGKLIRIWQWFDKHTVDGNAFGVTYSLPDRIANVTGFAEAMVFVGWLEQNDTTLTMPKFDRHTSQSAKTRALTNKRVAKNRNAAIVTESLPEKRREEKNITTSSTDVDGSPEEIYSSAFLTFWDMYPRKVNKGLAYKAFKKIKASEYPAVKEGLIAKKKSADWLKDNGQFIPHPSTWLNARGWEDEDCLNQTGKQYNKDEFLKKIGAIPT